MGCYFRTLTSLPVSMLHMRMAPWVRPLFGGRSQPHPTASSCPSGEKASALIDGLIEQAVAEGKDVTHWATNKGTTPLTYLAVEIGKEP